MERYRIFGYGGYNGRSDFNSALECATEMVRYQWVQTGELGACYAVIYDMLNRRRVFVWLAEDMTVQSRKWF